MTVTDNFRVDIRRFSGYSNPALPIASYISQGGSVGDASGGSVFQNLLFRLGSEPDVSRSLMYNLEQLSADISANTAEDVLFRTLNMGQLAPNRPESPQKWILSLRNDGVDEGAANIAHIAGLPLWLGSPNAGGSDAGIRWEWDNIDLRLYAVTIQGYIWGPRSVLADGGPQRPPNGMFR